jgi:hypothetical protein
MKIRNSLLIASTLYCAATTYVTAQNIGLGFDTNRISDFGTLKATTTELTSSLTGSIFSSMSGLSNATYTISATQLTVIPEAGTYALLSGFCALIFVMLRRRQQ